MGGVVVLLVVIVLVLWVFASCIRIVPQAYAVVLERLGAYKATCGTGIKKSKPERTGCGFSTAAGNYQR